MGKNNEKDVCSTLYGVDNECESTFNKYDRKIGSVYGIIGLKKSFCDTAKIPFYELYLNDEYVDDISFDATDEEILNIIKQM